MTSITTSVRKMINCIYKGYFQCALISFNDGWQSIFFPIVSLQPHSDGQVQNHPISQSLYDSGELNLTFNNIQFKLLVLFAGNFIKSKEPVI